MVALLAPVDGVRESGLFGSVPPEGHLLLHGPSFTFILVIKMNQLHHSKTAVKKFVNLSGKEKKMVPIELVDKQNFPDSAKNAFIPFGSDSAAYIP